jgi:hypothetical protein
MDGGPQGASWFSRERASGRISTTTLVAGKSAVWAEFAQLKRLARFQTGTLDMTVASMLRRALVSA